MAKSKKSKTTEQKPVNVGATTKTPEPSVEASETSSSKQSAASNSIPQDFESLYLQQVTKEFADDIDRLRNAKDFTENSVPILIEALKQGACVYSEDEKRRVMGNR